jgi:hypothetical protein
MYNENIKKYFIENLRTYDMKTMYSSIFRRAEAFETEREKDIFDFDVNECMNLLLFLNPKSTGHVASLISQLSKYSAWALSNGKSEQNYWAIVPVDEEFAKFSFASRNVKDLDELTRIAETYLSVPFDKYAVYLLYMGVMGENFSELTQLKDTDVDSSRKTITTSRRTHTALVEPIFELIASNEYYEEKKTRDYDSPYFVKPYKTKKLAGEPISYQNVHRVIKKLNDNYNEANSENPKQFIAIHFKQRHQNIA